MAADDARKNTIFLHGPENRASPKPPDHGLLRQSTDPFRSPDLSGLRAYYSQHQKCVIVDVQGDGNNLKITALVGGPVLCDGCNDTPKHRLFHDLNTIFKR